MKRFKIHVETEWCGEWQDFVAYANSDSELESIAGELAYENFENYPGTGLQGVLGTLFPDVEDDEYTEEQNDAAAEASGEYYSYSITEWDETDDEEWDGYDLVYDGRETINE